MLSKPSLIRNNSTQMDSIDYKGLNMNQEELKIHLASLVGNSADSLKARTKLGTYNTCKSDEVIKPKLQVKSLKQLRTVDKDDRTMESDQELQKRDSNRSLVKVNGQD